MELEIWDYFSDLRAEIERLKTFGGSSTSEVHQAALTEVTVLKEKLVQTQNLLADSTRFASVNIFIYYLLPILFAPK